MCLEFSQSHSSSFLYWKFLNYIDKNVEPDKNPAEKAKYTVKQMKIVQKDKPHLLWLCKENESSKTQNHKFYHRSHKNHCLEFVHHFSNLHSHYEVPQNLFDNLSIWKHVFCIQSIISWLLFVHIHFAFNLFIVGF